MHASNVRLKSQQCSNFFRCGIDLIVKCHVVTLSIQFGTYTV